MPPDRGEPWPGATYNGFSGGPTPPTGQPRRDGPSRGVVVGAIVATAVGLGLAGGLLLRPDHRALSAAAPQARVTRHMPIEVTPPAAPQPVPRAAGKLEVLDPAAAAQAGAAAPLSPAPGVAPAPPPSVVRYAQAGSPLMVVPSQQAFAPPPAAARDRCATSRGRADALVCADPEIAGYDRELNRAFGRAMRSGAVTPEDLRADQRDWLGDREAAARRSPQALADAYQDRIEELNRIADAGPGDAGD